MKKRTVKGHTDCEKSQVNFKVPVYGMEVIWDVGQHVSLCNRLRTDHFVRGWEAGEKKKRRVIFRGCYGVGGWLGTSLMPVG